MMYDPEHWESFLRHRCSDQEEISIMKERGFLYHLWRANEIKDMMTRYGIPFFIRGSAGSSRVLRSIGMTTIHPDEYGAVRERFIHRGRESMGDIDFDVPSSRREEVYRWIGRRFPDVYRISNHIHLKERSVVRYTLKHKFGIACPRRNDALKLEKYEIPATIWESAIKKNSGRLIGHAKHVGGICFPETKPPAKDILRRESIPQLLWDKREIEKKKILKLDVLSNHALDLLVRMDPAFRFSSADAECPLVFASLRRGDTLGILYGESPMMRQAFHQIQPYDLMGIAECLAYIRPSNRHRRRANHTTAVFDDDVIRYIAEKEHISLGDAEKKRKQPIHDLQNNHLYGFCRSHAMHYAILIYWLAYYKVHHPDRFYPVLFDSLQEFPRMYRSWVYAMDAIKKGYWVAPICTSIRKLRSKWRVLPGKRLIPIGGYPSRLFPLSTASEIRHFDFFSGNRLDTIPNDIVAFQRSHYSTAWCFTEQNLTDRVI